jgi:nicotinamidase-related amidase
MNPIVKDVFSCARNEEFKTRLQELHVHNILLAGIEAHVCVYQTAMDLLDQDYGVHVAADAVSSRTDSNKQLGLERMLLEGVVQTSVEMVLFELQGIAKGERFRELAKLVK